MPKYEYLTKKDSGYKPDAVEKVKFEYSPIGKVFTDGLAKEDKSKKIGLFKRLKNIEDNLVKADDNDNKVGIFRIIKDIKDKGIKIDNDDEAVRKIRECIKELMDDGVKVNNFDEMKKKIIEHVKNLKEQGANVKLIVCFYHVTYEFESESTLYSCLNDKELLTRSRCHI